MSFFTGRGFGEVKIKKKKWNWPYFFIHAECFDEILYAHWYWQNLAHKDCQIKFAYGRGFAEVQILKKKKINWPYLLNRVEHFGGILRV